MVGWGCGAVPAALYFARAACYTPRTMSVDVLAFRPAVKRVARKLLGPAAPYNDVRDLEQDGYLALVRAATRYNGTTATFATFADQHWKGAMIDGLRRWHPRSRRTGASKIEWTALDDDPRHSPDPSPLTVLLNRELRSIVDELPWTHRDVLVGHYWRGEPLHVIATRHRVTVPAIYLRHKAALTFLRSRLA